MNQDQTQWREFLGRKQFLMAVALFLIFSDLLILNWMTHIPIIY